MPTLDLSRFAGFDLTYTQGAALHRLRRLFADEVITYAAKCRNNRDLLDALTLACDPALGLHPPRYLGEGSTRRVYSLPFGLALKLRRTTPLDPADLQWRGGKRYLPLLTHRRVRANFTEMGMSVDMPYSVPRVYGFLVGFGEVSALIVERMSGTLADLRPDDRQGIDKDQLYFHATTGEILITDPRFKRSTDDLKGIRAELRYDRVFPGITEGLWLGNIGHDAAGRRYLMDTANLNPSLLVFASVLCQLPWGAADQLMFSRTMMDAYEKSLGFGGVRVIGEVSKVAWNAHDVLASLALASTPRT